MYFPGGAGLGSPVLPHAALCPEGVWAANKAVGGWGPWRKGSQIWVI